MVDGTPTEGTPVDGGEERREEGDRDLIQLRFTGLEEEGNTLDARELAESIQGLADLVGDIAKTGVFGIDGSPEVRVRPSQEGSFIQDALVVVQQMDPEVADSWFQGVGAAGVVGTTIHAAILRIRNPVVDVEEFGDGQAKLKFQDKTVTTVPMVIWEELSREKVATKRALRKLMGPLRDDASELEIRTGRVGQTSSDVASQAPVFTANKSDYDGVSQDGESEEFERVFNVVARIDRIDRYDPTQWRISVEGERSRKATMGDDDFFRSVISGVRVLDLSATYDIELYEWSSTLNGRLRREWTVRKVIRTRDEGTDVIDSSEDDAADTDD